MIMAGNIASIKKSLKKRLDHDRYQHTLGVAYTAMCLAMKYDINLYQANVAGLLHDCAKCIPDGDKIEKCEKYNIPINEAERQTPMLLHAKLGAFYAIHKYDIHDLEISNAILNHTTGKPGMSMLEKIIFVADYIEPGRDKAPRLDEVRKVSFENIDQAVLMILEDTVPYVEKKQGTVMDPLSIKALEYYRKEVKNDGTGKENS